MPDSPYQPALIALASLLGDRLSTGASVLALHARDEAHTTPAMPDAVAFPQTTDEVADIVKICAAHGCPVIPFGIGTSLEGHVVPVHGGVSVDLSRMNAVLDINSRDMTATVEPGVTRT
ncbi:MAG TPA: 2-hydroxy-acid oxidase, partial [Alphaproteobacteria bacterium]|nr:2-hydroxy-acid oxidase [Alphaproteobacteria bacterium]